MKLTISRKLLLGYLCMAFLTVLASAFALYNLQRLHQVARDITQNSFSVMDHSKQMINDLLAAESAEKRYLILKDPVLEQLFRQRGDDFRKTLDSLENLRLDPKTRQSVREISRLHLRLLHFFDEEVILVSEGRVAEAQALSESGMRELVDGIAGRLRDIQFTTDQAINDKMGLIAEQGRVAVNVTWGLGVFSLILGISLALLITRNISKPLKQLQEATRQIAKGDLDYRIEARRDDEIGALATSFAHMTQRLKVLEELNLDASPLTGLPGNLAIENRIQQMQVRKQMFSLCQVDLDNFKPFADRYGYAWGSEMIKELADMLKVFVAEVKSPEVFIGHIGGDDFVLIGDPQPIEAICQRLVDGFELRIRKFYSKPDAEKGYFTGRDRHGVIRDFPLVSVTAAIVTDDGTRFSGPLEMAQTAAELKERAKMLPGSNYLTQDALEVSVRHDLQAQQRLFDF